MKKFLFVSILLIILCSSCSNTKSENVSSSETKEPHTFYEAIENNPIDKYLNSYLDCEDYTFQGEAEKTLELWKAEYKETVSHIGDFFNDNETKELTGILEGWELNLEKTKTFQKENLFYDDFAALGREYYYGTILTQGNAYRDKVLWLKECMYAKERLTEGNNKATKAYEFYVVPTSSSVQ